MNDEHKDMTDPKLEALFSSARARRRDTSRVEYGFETRLMARIRDERAGAPGLWQSWTWRLMPAFGAVVMALGIWMYVEPVVPTADLAGTFDVASDAALLKAYGGED
jgi:hypothetical protein